MGCIGAWVLKHLVDAGKEVVSYDLSSTRHRVNALISAENQHPITFVQGDLTDYTQLVAAIEQHAVTHIIHLAALQVPFCKADPIMGAQVNVVGTVNILEAARQAGIKHLTYASSIAAFGSPDDYPKGLLAHDALPNPHTLYGVYKVANENTARVYWQDYGVSSIGLRPYTVYGVGRDQGLTSDPTKAIIAALKGEPFEIGFSGGMQFHLASDVALQFIAAAEQTDFNDADVFALGTPVATVAEFVNHIRAHLPNAQITQKPTILPFPPGCDDSELRRRVPHVYETPLADGISQTVAHFRRLI